MSSHQIKVSSTIRAMENLKKVFRANAKENEYIRGVYNGFEIASATLTGRDPQILEGLGVIEAQPELPLKDEVAPIKVKEESSNVSALKLSLRNSTAANIELNKEIQRLRKIVEEVPNAVL